MCFSGRWKPVSIWQNVKVGKDPQLLPRITMKRYPQYDVNRRISSEYNNNTHYRVGFAFSCTYIF